MEQRDIKYTSNLKNHTYVSVSGILVAKRWMFMNAVPGNCGGGTVLYVSIKIILVEVIFIIIL